MDVGLMDVLSAGNDFLQETGTAKIFKYNNSLFSNRG